MFLTQFIAQGNGRLSIDPLSRDDRYVRNIISIESAVYIDAFTTGIGWNGKIMSFAYPAVCRPGIVLRMHRIYKEHGVLLILLLQEFRQLLSELALSNGIGFGRNSPRFFVNKANAVQ